MTTYDKLLDQAASEDITVIENHGDFSDTKIKGLYCNNFIALSKDLSTSAERASVLAEEIGHHYTTSGNILGESTVMDRKQEQKARLWAYNKLIGLNGIINSYKYGCCNLSEMAEYLEVTEKFLSDALEKYRSKYGVFTTPDNYIIYFEPNLTVIEMY